MKKYKDFSSGILPTFLISFKIIEKLTCSRRFDTYAFEKLKLLKCYKRRAVNYESVKAVETNFLPIITGIWFRVYNKPFVLHTTNTTFVLLRY